MWPWRIAIAPGANSAECSAIICLVAVAESKTSRTSDRGPGRDAYDAVRFHCAGLSIEGDGRRSSSAAVSIAAKLEGERRALP